MSGVLEERELISKLTGTTTLVYWYLLKKGKPAGTREVMRALKFSSPSTATHHLEKLRRLGLVEKNPVGSYRVVRLVKTGLFETFLFVRGYAIPKQFVYALLLSSSIALYMLFFFELLTLVTLIVLLPAIIGCAILWYETVFLWKRRPRFE